ncbi:MAG: universal stress protein [Ilumatobacteraceae bacterium]
MSDSSSKRRVLIAVDDAVASEATVRSAHRLFGDDVDYLLINVSVEPLPPSVVWGRVSPMMMPFSYPLFTAGGTDELSAAAAAASASITSEVADKAGLVPTEQLAAVGDVADAIVRAAHEHDVDVIVVSSHERSWLSRLFQPPTAATVIKHSDIPVLIVR